MDLSKRPMIAELKCSDIGMGSVHTWHAWYPTSEGLKLCIGMKQGTSS